MVGLIPATVPLLINRHLPEWMASPAAEASRFGTGITPAGVSQSRKQKPFSMNPIDAPNPGQPWARARWNSHGSGAAFHRTKQPYLAPEMKDFAESQYFCILSFVGNACPPG